MCDTVWWVRYRAGQALLKLKGMTADRLDAVRMHLTDAYARDMLDARAAEAVIRERLPPCPQRRAVGLPRLFHPPERDLPGVLVHRDLAAAPLHGRPSSAAERVYSHLQMPISLVVPAYNEAATIATSVRALLQLRYQHFEVIIVNDGSKDDTLATMIREFELTPFPEAYRVQIKTKPVRGIYRSLKHPNLRVIDKENGGSKADATNAGINAARYPIFYCGDADSVLDPGALEHVVRPFLEDPTTVACGGTVRIINGCKVRGGVLEEVGLPRNPLALVQVVEYLRAFLGGRHGLERDQRHADRVRRIRRVPPRHRGGGGRLSARRDRRGHGADRAAAPHAG